MRAIVLIAATLGAMPLHAAELPAALQPPKEQVRLFHFTGKGSQIYVCQKAGDAFVWTFKAPDAKLFDASGALAGKHFAGPTWEAKDGSQVVGKVVTNVPSADPTAIPLLLLTAVSRAGEGIMKGVQSIQRLDTKGGKAPAGGCDAQHENGESAVSYQAEYYFYGASTR
jgi:FtsP/CotA-like multicopper oxidase with cupredoxin domain